MTKKIGTVIVTLVLFSMVLSGCKMPASKAPSTEEAKSTAIKIQTDTQGTMTQLPIGDPDATATLALFPTITNTPEPTEVIVIPTLTRPAEYTVHEDEYLYCLARRFDLNPQDLLALNPVGDSISPGTVLKIPQTGSWSAGERALKAHPTTYTVVSGDTIYSIACDFGDLSPEAIIAANKLEEPYTLTAGQTLQIP